MVRRATSVLRTTAFPPFRRPFILGTRFRRWWVVLRRRFLKVRCHFVGGLLVCWVDAVVPVNHVGRVGVGYAFHTWMGSFCEPSRLWWRRWVSTVVALCSTVPFPYPLMVTIVCFVYDSVTVVDLVWDSVGLLVCRCLVCCFLFGVVCSELCWWLQIWPWFETRKGC